MNNLDWLFPEINRLTRFRSETRKTCWNIKLQLNTNQPIVNDHAAAECRTSTMLCWWCICHITYAYDCNFYVCVCACEHHKYFYTPTYIRQQQILNFLEFCGSTKLVITAVTCCSVLLCMLIITQGRWVILLTLPDWNIKGVAFCVM